MAGNLYTGKTNNISAEVKKIYFGDDNYLNSTSSVAHIIHHGYIGDSNGIARKIFPRMYLPSGYQQVEYIEGTGTQYINTEIIQNSNQMAMEITVAMTNNNYGSKTGWIMGSYADNKGFCIFVQRSSKKENLVIGVGNYTGNVVDFAKHIYKIDMANLKIYVDGISKTKTSSAAYSRTINNRDIYILYGDTTGTAEAIGQGKVYNAKIWNNNELIHNYYPCYRTFDNEPGLYDIITDTFLTNAGTGVFLIGPKREEQL